MEIEIKLKYKNKKEIISYLEKNLFKLDKIEKIEDKYFGTIQSMSNKNDLYRIRVLNDQRKELTLKTNFTDKNSVWTRNEYNVAIDNIEDMVIILNNLCCTLIKENVSIREIWTKKDIRLEFIEFVKPVKLKFIEIEGNNIESIDNIVSQLKNNVTRVGEEIFKVFDKSN